MVLVAKIADTEFREHICRRFTDVVGDKLGGKIVAVSDEWFAPASNLIKNGLPVRDATKFTFTGAWYDGWETRRHNPEEADWVVFKFGVSSAALVGCEVDTSYFNGNHAPQISVEATTLADDDDYENAEWEEVFPKVSCGPSTRQFFARVELTEKTYTHARLKMYPDGGIARFRLYGRVHPIVPQDLSEVIDTASCLNGGVCVAYSDQHFGYADNLCLPGRGIDMSDGWETKRSREKNHTDWAVIKLGYPTKIQKIGVDTAFYRGNYPAAIVVHAINTDTVSPEQDDEGWKTVVPKSVTVADKEHEYELDGETVYTHIRLTMIPDGGVKRLHAWGTLVPKAPDVSNSTW